MIVVPGQTPTRLNTFRLKLLFAGRLTVAEGLFDFFNDLIRFRGGVSLKCIVWFDEILPAGNHARRVLLSWNGQASYQLLQSGVTQIRTEQPDGTMRLQELAIEPVFPEVVAPHFIFIPRSVGTHYVTQVPAG